MRRKALLKAELCSKCLSIFLQELDNKKRMINTSPDTLDKVSYIYEFDKKIFPRGGGDTPAPVTTPVCA